MLAGAWWLQTCSSNRATKSYSTMSLPLLLFAGGEPCHSPSSKQHAHVRSKTVSDCAGIRVALGAHTYASAHGSL
jgi:hypothetical protein